ncbi:ATP-dependent DNA helicase RecQ [Hyphomicrobium nitrativorans NL23]|uniref:DNA helicase RecQ n=1 Tax=Hyphomicrobium nitrativorans NL23 TaxID=1029756 RepID=V5SG65_9HYPH|nr:ATP-dependent DNA helicase RecQ [Hyphomicrobium nitrativorans NL23]
MSNRTRRSVESASGVSSMPPAALRRPEPAATNLAPSASSLAEAQHVLEDVFGYKAFRLHQAGIIETLLSGGDVLALMPTGGGKSLCYQIPALVRAGTGLVVSPLIALMQDQVDALREAGVRAAFLNSSQDWREQAAIEQSLIAGDLDLLYVAPERLVQERTLSLLERASIALFAIDEAHCVSQWGHDFRPEYRQLRILAERFPRVPRIALTATADDRTRDEIARELSLERAHRFVASFDRPNIRYTIAEMGSMSARERLWSFLSAEHPADAGIVYCLSRKSVEETADWLNRKGRPALAYHAGLPPELRREHQARFLKEDGIVMVATIAFGMGIDKPDVRFVAHLNLPRSLEAYYQETGRAGRDGEPANAWLAYGMQDIVQQKHWINASEGSDAYKRTQSQKLDALVGLCETTSCRRQLILAYFSETRAEPCGNCDNCLNPPQTTDGTELARKALSAVYRTEQRFGVGYLIDVLTGKDNERAIRNSHDRLSVWGIGKTEDAAVWRSLFRQLVARGLLVTDDEGHGTLALTEEARPLLRGEETFRMRLAPAREKKSREKRASAAASTVTGADRALYDALRALRLRLATEAGLPPYVICHDKTLAELAAKRPADEDSLHGITGLGARKIERYGAAFLGVISQFKPHPTLDNRLSATVNQTLALHLAGQDAERIAAERGLEIGTIYTHLAEAIEAGVIAADDVLDLDPGDLDEIHAAFERLDTLETGKLGPAHAALDGRFDYGVLRCILAELA